jgi:hypothetical protein
LLVVPTQATDDALKFLCLKVLVGGSAQRGFEEILPQRDADFDVRYAPESLEGFDEGADESVLGGITAGPFAVQIVDQDVVGLTLVDAGGKRVDRFTSLAQSSRSRAY